MTLYSDTLISHSYRFKRLMLAFSDTEIEQTLRDARLLFENLDQVLTSPTEATEKYRNSIERLVQTHNNKDDISLLKIDVEQQYAELSKLLYSINNEQ